MFFELLRERAASSVQDNQFGAILAAEQVRGGVQFATLRAYFP